MYACMYVCMYVHVCMYACMYLQRKKYMVPFDCLIVIELHDMFECSQECSCEVVLTTYKCSAVKTVL